MLVILKSKKKRKKKQTKYWFLSFAFSSNIRLFYGLNEWSVYWSVSVWVICWHIGSAVIAKQFDMCLKSVSYFFFFVCCHSVLEYIVCDLFEKTLRNLNTVFCFCFCFIYLDKLISAFCFQFNFLLSNRF